MRFRVWAPLPTRVDLVLDDRRVPMERDDRGWWHADADAAAAALYGYSLDGGPPRPDPRARALPHGVDGLAQLVADDHPWADQRWTGRPLAGSVIYEAHVGTFSPVGTFDGMVDKLPQLVELGVDVLELMPVHSFPGRHGWGYDSVGLFAPHEPYGGVAGLRRLVDAAHGVGLAVVLDVVYNHLGPSGNHLPAFGPYLSDRHHTGWGQALNFDGPGSDEVRAFVVDNVCMWLRDFHVDGLRLDATDAIVDDSATHVLAEMADAVDRLSVTLRRPLFLIAENNRNDPRLVRSPEAGGFGLDAVWADDWHHAVHVALSGDAEGYYEDFTANDALATALRRAWVFDGRWSPHRQRRHGASPAGLAGRRFVVATQNHDQVGNRATGNRFPTMVTTGRLKIAAALLLTSPFTPMLFQGEEWAASTPFQYFTDHADPELAAAVREGRRAEFAAFGWDPDEVPDPQDPETFARSHLDWDERATEPHAEMWAWYRELLRLRRRCPALHDDRPGSIDARLHGGTLVVSRGDVRIIANLSDVELRSPLRPADRILLASSDAIVPGDGEVLIPPDAVAIVEHTGP